MSQSPPPPPPYGGPPSYGGPPDPYGAPGPYGYGPRPDQRQATTALVLGILGVVVCTIVAPFAWSIGRNSLREIDASGGALGGRGKAQAGYILGIIGTILLAASILVVILVFAVAASGP